MECVGLWNNTTWCFHISQDWRRSRRRNCNIYQHQQDGVGSKVMRWKYFISSTTTVTTNSQNKNNNNYILIECSCPRYSIKRTESTCCSQKLTTLKLNSWEHWLPSLDPSFQLLVTILQSDEKLNTHSEDASDLLEATSAVIMLGWKERRKHNWGGISPVQPWPEYRQDGQQCLWGRRQEELAGENWGREGVQAVVGHTGGLSSQHPHCVRSGSTDHTRDWMWVW